MATITEEAGKYIVITVCGLAVLAITAWFNTPTLDDFRTLMEREAPWVQDKQAFVSEITSIKDSVSVMMAKMDRLESTQDNLKSDINGEMRIIHLSLQRILGRLDVMDANNSKGRSKEREQEQNYNWERDY